MSEHEPGEQDLHKVVGENDSESRGLKRKHPDAQFPSSDDASDAKPALPEHEESRPEKFAKTHEGDTPAGHRAAEQTPNPDEAERARLAASYEPYSGYRERRSSDSGRPDDSRRHRDRKDDDRYDDRNRRDSDYNRKDSSSSRYQDYSQIRPDRRSYDHQSRYHERRDPGTKDRFGRDIVQPAYKEPEHSSSSSQQRSVEKPALHDIEEKTVKFQLKFSRKSIGDDEWWDLDHKDLAIAPVVDLPGKDEQIDATVAKEREGQRMVGAPFAKSELIRGLWKQKDRMDDLFDRGKGSEYYYHRDSRFEQDRRGSSKFLNRAGDKLWEVHEAFKPNLFDEINKSENAAFADVCGGPGAFSEMLLKRCNMPWGYGITLQLPDTPKTDIWYKQLQNPRDMGARFTIHEGVPGGKGDVYSPENLEAMCKTVLEDDKKHVSAVVADGGFKIQKFNGKHMENYQELFSHRIILSEFLFMIRLLEKGGQFVCKLFDSFSALTVSLMYMSGLVFDECYVVKPLRSRIVNSERYFVGYHFKGRDDPHVIKFTQILVDLHKKLVEEHAKPENSPPTSVPLSPLSVVPLDVMTSDDEFMATVREMNDSLAQKQSLALGRIMDAVDEDEKNRRVRRHDR